MKARGPPNGPTTNDAIVSRVSWGRFHKTRLISTAAGPRHMCATAKWVVSQLMVSFSSFSSSYPPPPHPCSFFHSLMKVVFLERKKSNKSHTERRLVLFRLGSVIEASRYGFWSRAPRLTAPPGALFFLDDLMLRRPTLASGSQCCSRSTLSLLTVRHSDRHAPPLAPSAGPL